MQRRTVLIIMTLMVVAIVAILVASGRQAQRTKNATIARPLPISLTVVPLIQGLPPDPGPAGDATLQGIDSDGDGIRDDIQRYIALSYPNEPVVRAGLRQFALVVQAAILDASSEEASVRHGNDEGRAQQCLWYIMDDAGDVAVNALLAEMLDTDARSRAYIKYNEQLGGHVFSVDVFPDKSYCDFDPDSL